MKKVPEFNMTTFKKNIFKEMKKSKTIWLNFEILMPDIPLIIEGLRDHTNLNYFILKVEDAGSIVNQKFLENTSVIPTDFFNDNIDKWVRIGIVPNRKLFYSLRETYYGNEHAKGGFIKEPKPGYKRCKKFNPRTVSKLVKDERYRKEWKEFRKSRYQTKKPELVPAPIRILPD